MFKRGLTWIAGSLLFNIMETAYFGWNIEAQSTNEAFCDLLASVGFLIGLALICGYAIGKTTTIKIVSEQKKNCSTCRYNLRGLQACMSCNEYSSWQPKEQE